MSAFVYECGHNITGAMDDKAAHTYAECWLWQSLVATMQTAMILRF
jgi:hypothetical protein